MAYFTFPMKIMNISQNYSSSYSHLKHTQGWPVDYPIDCSEKDNGRGPIFATVNLRTTRKNDERTTNTIWLQTVNYSTCTHLNDTVRSIPLSMTIRFSFI